MSLGPAGASPWPWPRKLPRRPAGTLCPCGCEGLSVAWPPTGWGSWGSGSAGRCQHQRHSACLGQDHFSSEDPRALHPRQAPGAEATLYWNTARAMREGLDDFHADSNNCSFRRTL